MRDDIILCVMVILGEVCAISFLILMAVVYIILKRRIKMNKGFTEYTVRRIRQSGVMYERTHGAYDPYSTVCGKDITHNWTIITNDFSGTVSCRKCLKILKENRDGHKS